MHNIDTTHLVPCDYIPNHWKNIIIDKYGNYDIYSASLLAEILRWTRYLSTAKKTFTSKSTPVLEGNGLITCYEYLCTQTNSSKDKVKRALVKLRNLGMITTDVINIPVKGGNRINKLLLTIDKDVYAGSFRDPKRDARVTIEIDHDDPDNPSNLKAKQICSSPIRKNSLTKKDRSMKSNFCENSFEEKKEQGQAVNPKAKTNQPTKKPSYNKPRQLADFHPLSKEDGQFLVDKSGRGFSLNAMNEILKDMSKRLTDKIFFSKKGFMKYMTLSFSGEMRDAVKTNSETFKIRSNQSAEDQQEKREEEYLTELENSLQVSPEWHFRKKLAAVLERDRAYKLLTAYKSINLRDGIARINLTKNVELTEIEQELVLSQIKASHCGIEQGEYQQIERLELNMPEKRHKARSLGKQTNVPIFPDTIWGKIRSHIAKNLGDTGVDLDKSWFSRLDAEINEESRAITLKAPSSFVKDWIENNYQKHLDLAVKQYGFNLDTISC